MSSRPVLQASAWYPPEHVGGTEVYLQGLVEGLAARGFDSTVLTPRSRERQAPYVLGSAKVIPFPERNDVGAEAQMEAFAARLEALPDAIYHQHAWTPDCGLDHLRMAKAKGLRTVLTVHVPSNLCLRGTMMRFGERACQGPSSARECAACWSHSRGAPAPLAQALASIPLTAARLPGRLGTALAARSHAERKFADLRAMLASADRVVAVCQWLFDALAAAGASRDQLILSRQGVEEAWATKPPGRRAGEGPKRLLYLGRWHPVKGVDLAVRALRAAPELDVSLTLLGVGGGAEERAYRAAVLRLAEGDRRIRFVDPAPRDEVRAIMAEHDALLIPSTWLETGPLVALEAQAVGLYVIGSRLGGIAELIDAGWKGRLVEPGDLSAWAAALRDFAKDGAPPLPAAVNVRTMAEAADDMVALYGTLE